METYWDLTERRRSELSADDVQRYLDAELMTKGVLRAKALELVDEPPMPEPDVTVYTVEVGYSSCPLAFATPDEAAKAAGLSIAAVGSSYIGRDLLATLVPYKDSAPAVKTQRIYSESRIADCRSAIEKASAAKAQNDSRRREHEARSKAEREALAGLWEDWHTCQALAKSMREVAETFSDYVRIAADATGEPGAAVIAGRFLLKVYPRERIEAAAEWNGITIPLPDGDPGLRQSAPETTEHSSIPF